MYILLFKFLLAHFLGDFVFQTKKMIAYKNTPAYFALHIGIHAALLSLFLIKDNMWQAILWNVLAHAFIDFLKLRLIGKMGNSLLFLIDQLLHLIVIAIVLCVFSTLEISFNFLSNSIFWLSIIAVVAATEVTAVCIRILLMPYQQNKTSKSKEKLKFRAGKYIGILERLFVLGFVIGHFWEGIGFLLAAKSIFRFGDLNNAKERRLTEYVLIGTLLSFGAAILIGLLFNYVLSVV